MNKNLYKTNLKLTLFVVLILLFSQVHLKKLLSKSQTKTKAYTFELKGNLWKKIDSEQDDDSSQYLDGNYWHLIAYGYNNKWVFAEEQVSYRCHNENFGEDPYNGVKKACYDLTGYTGFKSCADENNVCNLDGVNYYLVRYGISGKYTYKLTNASSIDCSNSVFGDPYKGEAKKCKIVKTGV